MTAPHSITFLFFLFLASSLSFLFVSLYIKKTRRRREKQEEDTPVQASISLSKPPSLQDLPKWLPSSPPLRRDDEKTAGAEEEEQQKRRRRRVRKKRQESRGGSDGGDDPGCLETDLRGGTGKVGDGKHGVDCPYPFSSCSSLTQRKIKLQYDQLVKSNHAKALTMAQVGQFVDCLVEARNELQHKSEIIQRSFKIKKALLFKADRSSFDRLCQQVYKLEAEHKRLEEDANVYNLLQEQLKLSPAYKAMLEIGDSMELKPTSDQATEFADISFEELLAQEKKDSFWQRNGKLRSCAR